MLELKSEWICGSCQGRVRSLAVLREGLCANCREEKERERKQNRARLAISQLLDREDVLILDTETTGMANAEVIELSVITTRGETLIDTLIKPKVRSMNPYAQRVHNISMSMLEDAPGWPEVLPELHAIAAKSTLLAWNASFDARMLEQTSSVWGLEHPRWLFVCAMRLYAQKCATKPRGLHKAVLDEDLPHLLDLYQSHRALADVIFVLEVLKATVGKV